MNTLITPLISIGNSKGIRIPKSFIKTYKLNEYVVIIPNNDGLFITTNKLRPRQNWGEQFQKSIFAGNKSENFGFQENLFDNQEWQW